MKIEYLLVKKMDDFCNTIDQFKNLLLTNVRVSIENDILTIGKCKIKYFITEQDIEVANELTFYLIFESMSEDGNQIPDLEVADKLLRRIIESHSNMFYINTIWDDISIYYATKAYPIINSLENKMRKIIYILMIRNIGSKWVEKNIPIDVKDAIKKSQEKNNVHNIIEDCLYSTDFIQLGYFLFKKYSINNNIQSLLELLKTNPLNINNIIDIYEPKSNWDRFFNDEIQIDNLLKKWETVYEFRNKVAHSKKIDSNDYNFSIKIIDELEEAFDKCLLKVNQVNMPDAERGAVEELAGESIEKNMILKFESILSPSLHLTKDYLTSIGLTDGGNISILADEYKGLSSLGLATNGNISILGDEYKGLSSLGLAANGNISILGDKYKGLSSLGLAANGNISILGDNYKGLSSLGLATNGNISILGDNYKGLSSFCLADDGKITIMGDKYKGLSSFGLADDTISNKNDNSSTIDKDTH